MSASSVVEEEGGVSIWRQLSGRERHFRGDDRQGQHRELDHAEPVRVDINEMSSPAALVDRSKTFSTMGARLIIIFERVRSNLDKHLCSIEIERRQQMNPSSRHRCEVL